MLLLCSFLIGGISIYKIQQLSQENTSESLAILCEEKASDIDNILEGTKRSVEIIASNALDELHYPGRISYQIYRDAYAVEMKRFLKIILKYAPNAITSYYRFNAETTPSDSGIFLEKVGDDIIDKLPTDIKKYQENDSEHVLWYYKPIRTKEPLWLEPYMNLNNGVYMISYIIPLFKEGITVGVVGMDLDFDTISNYISQVKIFKTGFAYLKNDNDDIIYHPKIPSGKKSVSESGFIEVSKRLTNGMKLVITAPKSEINHERNKLFAQIVGFVVLIAIIFIIITSEISKSMVHPLRSLTIAAQKIAHGNLDVVIESDSNDEIGTLAESFRRTVVHLKEYIEYINGLAYKDSLTGVKNKAAYDQAILQLEKELHNGSTKEYSIAVFDANGLKQINDTFGHEFGNQLIINSCKLICEVFSHSPIFRIGGDEFVAILKAGDYENREKLKSRMNDLMKSMEENEDICERVSIACGIADYKPGEKTTDVFKRADKEMYENKKLMKMNAAVDFIL